VSRTRGVSLAVWLLLAVPTAIFLGQLLFPDAALYARLAGDPLIYLGTLTKLTLLGLAAWLGWGCATRFETGNPIRPAWQLLSFGLLLLFFGQLSLAPYQLFLRIPIPFPSWGDVFFVLAYPLLIAAVIAFIRAYEAAGYPIGAPAERWVVGAGMGLLSALVGGWILRPVVLAPAPALEKFLNVLYPMMDFLLLIPTALLIRITLRFRGGEVWKVWLALLAGFVFLSFGDILFSYLQALGHQKLDPLVDAMYILAYGLLAKGLLYQRELLSA
jgi:hypothetical protein